MITKNTTKENKENRMSTQDLTRHTEIGGKDFTGPFTVKILKIEDSIRKEGRKVFTLDTKFGTITINRPTKNEWKQRFEGDKFIAYKTISKQKGFVTLYAGKPYIVDGKLTDLNKEKSILDLVGSNKSYPNIIRIAAMDTIDKKLVIYSKEETYYLSEKLHFNNPYKLDLAMETIFYIDLNTLRDGKVDAVGTQWREAIQHTEPILITNTADNEIKIESREIIANIRILDKSFNGILSAKVLAIDIAEIDEKTRLIASIQVNGKYFYQIKVPQSWKKPEVGQYLLIEKTLYYGDNGNDYARLKLIKTYHEKDVLKKTMDELHRDKYGIAKTIDVVFICKLGKNVLIYANNNVIELVDEENAWFVYSPFEDEHQGHTEKIQIFISDDGDYVYAPYGLYTNFHHSQVGDEYTKKALYDDISPDEGMNAYLGDGVYLDPDGNLQDTTQ